MEYLEQPKSVPVRGLLEELANRHTQTPKAVVKLHPQPNGLDGKPAARLNAGASARNRASIRMGRRDV